MTTTPLSTFAEKVINFHLNLQPPELSSGIEWINNFQRKDTRDTFTRFYRRFFQDHQKRRFLFGINPGRYGAGLTGVGFTDPVYLEDVCHIDNPFPKRHELSSHFIYKVIESYGTVDKFYKHHFITSLSPLGLLHNGKNYNYYDDAKTLEQVEPFIIQSIESQLDFGAFKDKALCIGKGKNFAYLSGLNKKHKWFDEIESLPHPRWVLQYNRKDLKQHIDSYLEALV